MRLRQKVALLLSTDLHAVARRLHEADLALQRGQDALAEITLEVGERLPTRPPDDLEEVLQHVGMDLARGRTEVLMAHAELTGRGPEKILPNRG